MNDWIRSRLLLIQLLIYVENLYLAMMFSALASSITTVLLCSSSWSPAVEALFVPANRNHGALKATATETRKSACGMTMFLEGSKPTKDRLSAKDQTSLGTLTIPQVGIGTISWSSDSSKFHETYHDSPPNPYLPSSSDALFFLLQSLNSKTWNFSLSLTPPALPTLRFSIRPNGMVVTSRLRWAWVGEKRSS